MVRVWCTWMGLAGAAIAAEPLDPFEHPDESEIFRAEERAFASQDTARAGGGVVVTVLTDRQLRERGYRSLAQALSVIPGLTVEVDARGRSVLYARGLGGPQRVAVVIDGVPWSDGLEGRAWLDESLPLSLVKQVEVIEGPGRLTFGDQAVAAVLNISTYRPEDLQGGFLRWEAGSWSRVGLSGVYGERRSIRGRDLGLRAYARAMRMDGDGSPLTASGDWDASGDAPRRAVGAGALLAAGVVQLRYDHVDWRYAPLSQTADDVFDLLLESEPFESRHSADLLSLRADLDISRRVQLAPRIYLQRYNGAAISGSIGEPELSVDGLGDSSVVWPISLDRVESTSERLGGSLDATLHLGLSHVTLLRAGVDSTRVVDVSSWHTEGQSPLLTAGTLDAPPLFIADAYGLVQHHWSAAWWLEFDGGLRVNRHGLGCLTSPGSTQACDITPDPITLYNPRIDVLMLPSSGTSLQLSAARAMRAPTAAELVLRDDPLLANPGLRPEILDRADLLVSVDSGRLLSARAGGTAGRVYDLIVPTSTGYRSADDIVFAGGRADAELRAGAWDLALGYAYTHRLDDSAESLTYGIPEHNGQARMTWTFVEGLRASLLGDFYGERAGMDGVVAPAYAFLHAAVATDALVGGRMRMDLAVRNLLDEHVPVLATPADLLSGVSSADSELQTGEGRAVVVGVEFAF